MACTRSGCIGYIQILTSKGALWCAPCALREMSRPASCEVKEAKIIGIHVCGCQA